MSTSLYTPDGRVKTITPANGKRWTLAELQGFVGGYIEVVGTVDSRWMVINEHGKILNPPLELNIPATRLYIHGRSDVILGPAVVVDTLEEFNEPDDEEIA